MPGLSNKPVTGYYECEYAPAWPGLVTNLPANAIPPGAASSCIASVVRGRLQPQPAIFPLTGTGGLPVVLPTLGSGENLCATANLQPPGQQQGFTVLITNVGVYIDYVAPGGTSKTFINVFNFPNSFPRYARFGTQVIGNSLYFSSGSQRGVYVLRPVFSLASVEVTNPGGYFTSAPTVVFSDGGGTGATATATISGANLTAVALTAHGSGYYVPPIVSFQGGSLTGPSAGQQNATAIGILAASPSGYAVAEVSAQTGVAYINVTAGGGGYVSPQVVFIGGGGAGASASAVVVGGSIIAITVNTFGNGYTSTPTVQIVDSTGTGAAATAFLFQGKPFVGGDFMATMSQRLILWNIIGGDGNTSVPVGNVILTAGGTGYATNPTVDFVGGGGEGAAATATEGGGIVTGLLLTAGGSLYYGTPAVNILSQTGTGATAIAQLSNIPQAQSTDKFYHDRLAYSAPNAYGYFDPNFGTAPGGYDTLTEARGVGSALAVVEGALFVGHNGGQTESTPNTSSSFTPFSFFPLWSADQTVLVRYGSLAQYGSTCCFLGNDSAYMLSPNGLQEIGQNIANLLQSAGLWNNGSFPLQGLYSSIVEIEGQKHYLIILSSDDWDFEHGSAVRQTLVYDYNMAESSWHVWDYTGVTATCPIYQSINTALYPGAAGSTEIAKDNWLLLPATSSQVPPPPSGPVILVTMASFGAEIPWNYVEKGSSFQQYIFISNTGGSTLSVSSIAITGPNAADFVLGGPTVFSVLAGATQNLVNVTFTPTSGYGITETATLTITSNAISGTQIFTLTGTSAKPGSSAGPYTPTPTNVGITATSTGGSPVTNTSIALVYPNEVVAGSQVVNIAANLYWDFTSLPSASGTGTVEFQYSIDSGATFGTFFTQSGNSGSGTEIYNLVIPTIFNLDVVQLRVVCIAQSVGGLGTLQTTGQINAAPATIVTLGDVFCQIYQKFSSLLPRTLAPVVQFGVVDTLGVYTSDEIILTNPTTADLTVSLAADTANGYAIVNQIGSTTLGANNANQLTFLLQLTNPQSGTHDDTTAVIVSIPSQVGPLNIEAWYSTPSVESATVKELAPVNRACQLIALSIAGTQETLAYQFRVESPSIARILQERRIAVEYENLEEVAGSVSLALNYTLSGQQDPTAQTSPTGALLNADSNFESMADYLPSGTAGLLPRQVLTLQQDFGTFAGVCTALSLASIGPLSLVRVTQIQTLPKAELT